MKKLLLVGLLSALPMAVVLAAWASTSAVAKGSKALICHVPAGNPDNAHVVSLPENAVSTHLDHGDCGAPAGTAKGDSCACGGDPGCPPNCPF